MGAGLLTTLSWAVNGLLATGSTAGHPGTAGGTAARHTPPARHTLARHGGDQASSAASPSASPSPSPSRAPAHHRASRAPHVSGRTPACAPDNVTLTLSSPQYWYQAGRTPRFTVRAASTESQPCHFDMGARFVSVIIDSSSGRQIWSSADCVSGSGSHSVVLASGTDAALNVSWDRRAS